MTFEELQAVNYHWRLAIDQVQEGILILHGPLSDPSAVRVVFANRAVVERTGFSLSQILTGGLLALVAPSDQARLGEEWNNRPLSEPWRGSYALATATGAGLAAAWTITSRAKGPNRDPDHTVTISWRPFPSAKEIAEPSPFEQSKADTISQIAKGVVHDFNNSLTAIRGHLEVALLETPDFSPPHLAIQSALEAVDTVTELCRRLLRYAKGQRTDRKPCEVAEILRQAVAITGLGSNVACRRLIQPNLWPIMADSIQIVQVINNLLMNARQAMPNGGVIVLVAENVPIGENSTLGLPPGNYVAITIRDRGVGIPQEHREHIFDALFTTKTDGTGLGLTTCANIVSAHDGYIDVNSAPNRGSEFIVYLPSAPVPEEPRLSPKREPEEILAEEIPNEEMEGRSEERRVPLTELKILIIEDQIGISDVARLYLEKNGHRVECAVDGQKGLRRYREAWNAGSPFDLVVVDMTLPGGLSGEDCLRELQKIDPQVVAIATSGYFDDDSWSHLHAQGFAAMLAKPFSLKLLGEVVHEAMLYHIA